MPRNPDEIMKAYVGELVTKTVLYESALENAREQLNALQAEVDRLKAKYEPVPTDATTT